MASAKYIVVEGPIGVGKTSLARILAGEFQGRTVFERVEDNPFLPKFYKSRESYAFQNQTFFLLNRYQQQMELAQQDLFNQNTVADYLFAKDQIFATLTLSAEELSLYQQIYALLNTRVPKPDLVVYLQARPEVLYKRVKKRDKKFERGVTFEYLTEVAQAYNQFFFHYDETPLSRKSITWARGRSTIYRLDPGSLDRDGCLKAFGVGEQCGSSRGVGLPDPSGGPFFREERHGREDYRTLYPQNEAARRVDHLPDGVRLFLRAHPRRGRGRNVAGR
jgi:deoxyadenosine/deoxycytidine kinase